jgi:hypothetical protein
MNATQPSPFAQSMRRIEALVEELERCTDPSARIAAQEMVRTVLEVHCAALEKMLQLLQGAGQPGQALLEACAKDECLGSVLLLHQLHPHDLPTRVGRALDRLHSKGADAELLGIIEGTVRLRLHAGRHSCASTAAQLRSLVEQAVADAAPDLAAVEWDEPAPPAAPVQLLQLGLLSRNGDAGPSAAKAPLVSSGSR